MFKQKRKLMYRNPALLIITKTLIAWLILIVLIEISVYGNVEDDFFGSDFLLDIDNHVGNINTTFSKPKSFGPNPWSASLNGYSRADENQKGFSGEWGTASEEYTLFTGISSDAKSNLTESFTMGPWEHNQALSPDQNYKLSVASSVSGDKGTKMVHESGLGPCGSAGLFSPPDEDLILAGEGPNTEVSYSAVVSKDYGDFGYLPVADAGAMGTSDTYAKITMSNGALAAASLDPFSGATIGTEGYENGCGGGNGNGGGNGGGCSEDLLTWTSPDNGHVINFLDIISGYGVHVPGYSTFFYNIYSNEGPGQTVTSVSHTDFGLNHLICEEVWNEIKSYEENNVPDTKMPHDVVDPETIDGTDIYGIKYDQGFEEGESGDFYFSLPGEYILGEIPVAVKVGGGQGVGEVGTICGPYDCATSNGNGGNGGTTPGEPKNAKFEAAGDGMLTVYGSGDHWVTARIWDEGGSFGAEELNTGTTLGNSTYQHSRHIVKAGYEGGDYDDIINWNFSGGGG